MGAVCRPIGPRTWFYTFLVAIPPTLLAGDSYYRIAGEYPSVGLGVVLHIGGDGLQRGARCDMSLFGVGLLALIGLESLSLLGFEFRSRLGFELSPGLLDSRENILCSLVLLFGYGTITVGYTWQDYVSLTL